MNILFLGTSAGWPLPRLGCHCPICTSSDPKNKRLRPSILVNKSVLIDTGPDFYHQIQSLTTNYLPLATIFISHNHPDHYFGLWDVAKIYKQKPGVFLSSKNKESLIKRINDFTITSLLREAKTFKHGQEILLPLSDQLAQSDKIISVTPFLVDHSTNTETFGFLLKEQTKRGKTKTLIYIPDFRTIPKDSLKYLKNADLAILDGSNFEPAGPLRWGHMPMKESIKLAKKLKIKKVYFTHLGHGPKMAAHQKLEEKVQKAGGKSFHIAYDGLKLKMPRDHTRCEKSKGKLTILNNKKPTKVHFVPRSLHTGCEGIGEQSS